ncbi:EAL domain-containing protein [Vulcaniibacterium tengchongense]|uniref:cyclic-guanylate-specific phosphodiesterase n=1 Tax=Vulcaniibacterium tengchongense TaxID=1273429 RepID=A0A3N4UXK2_9GAMM|nr:EAL domain-containing protein [Vulcaniibacterium tengchongense]RPE74858.1 diguanylate cyclase/phosphodiesterase with PAS/PAC sensor(s) [Vulcaniibacterium tengchongense]
MRPPLSVAAARLACLALASWLLALPAAAATRDFYFARLGSDRGLMQNTVTALAQDPEGFVWVGTQAGLHRYDGQRYQPYLHEPGNPASLPDSFVTALALEGKRALWVGTYNEYLARLDLADGRIRRYASAGPQHLHRQVVALLPDRGRVWVGTAAGLERFDPRTGRRETLLRFPSPTPAPTPPQALLAGADGQVWYGCRLGLFRIGAGDRPQRVGPEVPVLSLLRDRAGRLWLGRGDGLFRLHSNGRDLIRAWPQAATADPKASAVRSLVEAPDGRLWFAVPGRGLRRFDPASGAAIEVREEPRIEASLHDDSIGALLVDRGGMLWVGGQFRGVAVADPRGTRFRYVFDLQREAGTPASAGSVRALAQAGDGALWVGTDNARLLRYRIEADRFEDLGGLFAAAVPPGRPPPHVTGFAPAGDGLLWLATDAGLFRLDPRRRRIERVPARGLDGKALRTILRARDGTLWLGSHDGAFHYRPDSGALRHWPFGENGDGLGHPVVHAIAEDRRGRIWFGTGDGLDLLDPASGRLRHFRAEADAPGGLPGNRIRALYVDGRGTLWVGTHAGLARLEEGAGGRIRFADPLAGAFGARMPVPIVYAIAEGPAGRLWLSTQAGILRLDVATGETRRYGLADGLQDLEFHGGSAARLADGRIAFGGVRGFNLFDPRRIVDAGEAPPLRLLGASIGTRSGDDALGTQWRPARLDIPDGAGLLRLRVGSLDFAPTAGTRYRYRMDGFDPDWIDNGTRSEIAYTRLPSGRYTLLVQATNRDGLWSSQTLRIPVRVAPPLWRHPLVLLGAALLLLAALAVAVWRMHLNRQRERGYFRQIREREERLKLALWASGEQFWDFDLARRRLYRMRIDEAQGAAAAVPGVDLQSLIESELDIHPDDRPQVMARLREHLRGASPRFLSEHRVRDREGRWIWVRARGRVVERDAQGRALRVAGTARDVTANRSAERDRRIAAQVLNSMAEAVAVFDREFRFVSVNPAFTRMTGYTDAEVIGQPTRILDSDQHDPAFYQHVRSELQRNGRWSGEIWQQRKDGEEFLCWFQGSVVLDAGGRQGLYVSVLGDITDQKRAEQELRYLANYDTLTSLPNRALLSERLSRAIVRARRQGSRIAMLFLDLDRFKDINDSLGHAAGDRILRAAAIRLQQAVGRQHTVARLGGDEFTVVLENLAGPEQAEQVARNILAAFEAPLDLEPRHDVVISPSIGISLYPDHALVPTDLLKHADTAMYQAKAAGRRTYMRYTEAMDVETRSRATVSAALRTVLDRNELRLVFQPKLSLARGRITGVEALLRWSSPELGEVSPAQFIPLAEESGMILDIGEWALREACGVLKHWRLNGLDQLTMAVNVSALQLLRGNLPKQVARALVESGVPPEMLQLELTESVIMANAGQTSATLDALRALGVGLAVDDFGTGYSSLAYLKRLPITTLKIDKEFIGDLTRDADDEAITTTVITMAHSLGLNVIAEGVETEAQVRFLRGHGCDEIQGYWLARPLEAAHCLGFIRAWTPRAADPAASVNAAT